MGIGSRLFTARTWRVPPPCTGLFCMGAAMLLVLWPVSVYAQNFEVYCTNNSDGTTTCTGWEGGETLTCVNSLGGTSSCSSGSGRSFVCSRDSGGVASCRKTGSGLMDKPLNNSTDCTYTGDGNFVCNSPRRRSPQLIPGPTLTQPVPIDQPSLIDPKIDFDLIRPLSP